VVDVKQSIAVPAGTSRDTSANTQRRTSAQTGRGRSRLWSLVTASSVESRFIAILLLVFLAKGFTTALIHQPFTGHDEVAHYAYLEVVATDGRVPVIPDLQEFNDNYVAGGEDTTDRMPAKLWQYCSYVTDDWNFCGDPQCADPCYLQNIPPDYLIGPNGWVYTANHPPLFYLVMTPIYWLTDGMSPASQLYIFRMATIPFGMLTVLFAFLTVRTLFPRDRFLIFTVPAFVAFQPQIAYESTMLNNDILAIAFTSGVIYLLVVGLKKRFPLWNVIAVGAMYGLAALSKNTSLTAGFLIAFAMVFGLGIRNWREWIPKGALSAIIAGLLLWPWYLFLWATYGNFTALPQIKALQWWNYQNSTPPSIWDQLSDMKFFRGRWEETWGQFGWRLIPLDWSLLKIILYAAIFGAVGLAIYAWKFWRVQQPILQAETTEEAERLIARGDSTLTIAPWQVVALLMLGVTCVVGYYAILQFGTTFALTQARYYFTAINAGAILVMLGIRSWFPKKWLPYVAVAIFVGLVALNLIVYTEYVIPWNTTGQFARDNGF